MTARAHTYFVLFVLLLLGLGGCTSDVPRTGPRADDPEAGFSDGAPFDDSEHDVTGGKADFGYSRPTDLPALVSPEVRVSLDGFTAHLFDRATGFSAVYEVGLGRIGDSGKSHTPIGHYTTAADAGNRWWNIDARWSPSYYMGLPFLRFSKQNRVGNYTYAFHGPVTDELDVGYVSGGCVRMHPDDIIALYWLLRVHPGTPIAIQQEVELDAAGEKLQPGRPASLFDEGVAIPYGESLGPRVEGFVGDDCEIHADCGDYAAGEGSYCHPAGFCTLSCAGACPDLEGKAPTFCVGDTASSGGVCVPVANDVNGACITVSGTAPEATPRHVGDSGAPSATRNACVPTAT